MGINPDLCVEIRSDILEEVDGPMLKYGLQKMDGSPIVLPSNAALRPRLDLVKARYADFKRAS